TQSRPACTVSTTGNTGDRNQNIYTAQLSPGLVLSAPGNAKQLGTGSNGKLIQRQFPIVITNTSNQPGTYTLAITAQPTGGMASFLQFQVAGQPFPLETIQVQVPPLSSTSRAVFVTSTNVHATVTVTASGSGTASVTLNADPNNPPSSDTNIASTENYTPTIATPNIANPNIANPNIANPNIANPNIANPNIANPNIANPNIANPNIANPNIANPNIANPNIANQALSDGTITDGTWAITNTGNTSSAYAINVAGQTPPAGVTLQLVLYQNYTTPLAQGCSLTQESHFVPVANITNVTFTQLSQLLQPAATNPTLPGLALAPGQTAYITLRVFDANTNNPAQALNDYNPITQASTVVVSQGANTGTTTPPVTLTILTKSLPQATLTGVFPPQTLQATGGSGAYTWSIASGTLPTGITLTSGGVLSGTPTGTAAPSVVTVQVKDAVGDIAQQPLTMVVNPVPTITPLTLSPGDQGHAYLQTLSATGGTAPLSPFSISSGSLPSGLALNGSTITGTLGANATTSMFTAKISDANNVAATQSLTITVNAPPSITTPSLSTAEQGRAYSPAIAATGGTAPLAFTPQSVDGLTLTPSGTFTGTPAAQGSFPFTATVTDAVGATASKLFTLAVNPPLSLSAASLPGADQGITYQQTLLPSGGVPTTGTGYAWAVTSGSLPTGLSLATGGTVGTISGSPTATPGPYTFGVTVTDALGATASQTYSITVNAPPSLTAGALPNAAVGTPYSYTIPVTAGTPPFTHWTCATCSANLPAGLTFTNGTISGTPTGSGNGTINVTVTDAAGGTATASFTISSAVSTTVGFTGPYQLQYWMPSGSNGGTTTITPASGPSTSAQFAYSINTGGGGVSARTWTFQDTAAGTGNVSFNWSYTGFHAYYEVTALFQVFAGSNVVTLYNPMQQNCCTSPSGGFTASGTGTIAVTQGQAFGFTVGGSNYDTNSVLNGTLTITNFSAPFAPPANLTISPSSVPNGQYMSPYTPTTLSATGGSGNYTWSNSSALPLGMTLNPATGVISGTPYQAGIWNVTVQATDTMNSSLTGQTSFPVTVGLATAYAASAGNNCYMPYPTTPMFYQAAQTSGTWSVTATGLPAGEMAFIPGTDVLAGCLVGTTAAISSGSYQLQFTVTPSGSTPTSFALPLAVVAQDNQDNGSYNVDSEGVGNLPPSGFQQGVVTPGQSFYYQPGSFGSDAVPFSGNFLFGLAGMGPQVCDTAADLYATNRSQLTAPAQPGRYDLLFDGTTQACPQAAFPISPPPIVFESVDAIGTTVTYGGATISNVQLSSANSNAISAAANVLQIQSGGTNPNPVNIA
ncbi:MAG: putative Ig domain-containing protein, partial [Bryobacterales bacterium]|nr:putative Ig domain-containing protein [Bryobacterales bacterium]